MRKLIIILVVILVVSAIAVGVYFGYQKSKGVISPTGTTQGGGNLPIGAGGTGAGGSTQGGGVIGGGGAVPANTEDQAYFQDQKQRLSILTTQPVIGYWITAPKIVPKGTSTPAQMFYLNKKGDVVQILDVGVENVVASSSFGVPIRSLQNIDGSRAIVWFESGSLAIFDTATKVWQPLDSAITSVAFSPDGKNIAYIKPNGARNSIYTQNVSTTRKNLTLVATLSIQDFSILWPSANTIILASKPAYQFFGQGWYFDLNNKTLNLLSTGRGLEYVFSQKGNYGLQFYASDRNNISVSIINVSGKKLADMPFSTLGTKCSFAQDLLVAYCGIPARYSGSGFTLPDDYLKRSIFTNDSVYKIDLASSQLTKIVDSETAPIDATNIRAVSSTLFFVNHIDGLLYRFNMQ